MEDSSYRQWRNRLDRRLVSLPEWRAAAPPDLPGRITAVTGFCRGVVRAVNSVLPDAGIQDRNRYDALAALAGEILRHQSFSLAEYVYAFPGGLNPGIRILLEEHDWKRRIAVLMFEDVRQWRVDNRGEKVVYQPLLLDLEEVDVQPVIPDESRLYYRDESDWKTCLADALCLPVRLLYPE